MDVISGRPQNVRSGRPQDGQIGSLGDSWGHSRGTSSGRHLDQYFPIGSKEMMIRDSYFILSFGAFIPRT